MRMSGLPPPPRNIGMTINEALLGEFVNRFVGDRLGLYKALAAGPMLPQELASRTGTAARYVDEWLRGQAAGGYVSYDPQTGGYSLTAEQAFALTDPDGAVFAPGAFELALGALRS